MKKIGVLLAAALALFAACLPSSAQFVAPPIVGSVAGGPTAYTGSIPNFSTWSAFQNVLFQFTPNQNNSGDATFQQTGNVSVIHFKKLSNGGLITLAQNDLIANQPVMAFYNGGDNSLDIVNTGTAPGATGLPQGYLTPCQITSGSPVAGCTAGQLLPTGDVIAATALYYEPAFGNGVPIYNGSTFVNFSFSELTLTIPSSRLASTIYDVLIFSNAGVATPCFSVAWTTSTPGSGTRGSGAGTAQISQINGIWTNAVSASCVNGASTFTVPANQGTYVATCLIDGTNGQVTFHRTYGQNRKWACWNAYNSQSVTLQAGDGTTSWAYISATIRPSNNASANALTVITGLPIQYGVLFNERGTVNNSNASGGCDFGIGFNNTAAFSGTVGDVTASNTNAANVTSGGSVLAQFSPTAPLLGAETFTALEQAQTTNGCTIYGTLLHMLLTVTVNM